MKQEELQRPPLASLKSPGQRIRWHRLRLGLSQEALAEAIGASTRSLRRWERDLVLPQKTWRERLSRQFGLDPQDLFGSFSDERSGHSPLWTVPYARNPCFTGRKATLQTLHSVLTAKQSGTSAQALALSGLGGIGKTQVAIEYAYRYRQEYRAVFWLASETAESLLGSLGQIADLLQFPEREAAEQSRLIAATRHWFTAHAEWLVIADNVADLDMLQAVLPSLRQGALLLTTRHQALGTFAPLLELPPMSEEEGIALLLSRSSSFSVSSEVPLATATTTGAGELVRFLEGLPLALDQAGAYLQETGCSVADYIQRCRDQRKEVLARRGLGGESHPASVTTTVKLSVDQIAREHPAAPYLLRLCAFLYPEAIPEELFVADSPDLGPELGPIMADPYQFDLILAAVRSASLITRHPQTKTLSLHRLVQDVLRDLMEPAEECVWIERVVRLLHTAFPPATFDSWVKCERYVGQVLACAPLLEQTGNAFPEAGEVLYRAGSYLQARGRLAEAQPLLEQAVTLEEQACHPTAQVLLERLEKQAELYWMQGKYELAEPLLQRVLLLETQELGVAHSRIAETWTNLGLLYWHQGKYEQAEPLYLQALSHLEQHMDASHVLLAPTLSNLALLYWSQGKYEQAEPLYLRALAIREKQLGPEHPDIAYTANSLATLYRDQGNYEQAEPLCLRALSIREKQLGTDHPDLATSLNNLGLLYQAQKKYEQAEPLYLRALAIREKQLGVEHPDTAFSLHNLATLYRDGGNYEQAEQFFTRALAVREQQVGMEHPDTATTLHHFALMRQAQGNEHEAQALFERAFQIRRQVLGSEHPQTKETCNALSQLSRTTSQPEKVTQVE